MRKIRWTQKQREILHLVEQGLDDKAIQEKGHGLSSITRVRGNLKAGQLPPPIVEETRVSTQIPVHNAVVPASEEPQTDRRTIVKDKVFDTVSVGELQIEPQVWRINQYGGFLILNSHAYARQKFGYTGTVGDFLCDACQLARKAMGLDAMPYDYLLKEEHSNDGQQDTDEGGAILEEVGSGVDG